MRVDLHIHTVASDGCWTPERVVAGCHAEGIKGFAVADHDTVDSVGVAGELARESGLAFIPAVEISTLVDGHIFHILGYGIDDTDVPLVALLTENTRKWRASDDEEIRQLIALGYPIDYEEYLAYTHDPTRGGFKSYNYLLDKGVCSSPRDFFDNVRSKVNHQWPAFVHPAEAARAIRAAGGVPVLAHPGASLRYAGGVTEATLDMLLGFDVAGVECYSQYHDEMTTACCVDWCERHNLLVTGGSDYHGGFVGRKLGVPVVDTAQLRLGPLMQFLS
ncbi:MAG: PHP domain-containing protein [Anaerolineae bacterium]|nr:PHP domain-containing protein [Anaerolineae bacterium]